MDHRALAGAVAFAAALAAAGTGVAAIPAQARDGAAIVDSGSTNTAGYRIDVWSDGSAQLVLQDRAGAQQSAAKAFSVSKATAAKFFGDLQEARAGKATSQPCMKSASFGTSTHVAWHDWTSPDLDCPPGSPLTAALLTDVGAIRKASGIDSAVPLRRGMLPGIRPMPVATPSPRPSD